MKAFLAFFAYGALHSLLLTDVARGALEALLGPRAFRGLFRFGFTVQAVVLLVAVIVYTARLPDREILELTGPVAWGLWATRLASLGFMGNCAARFGVSTFLGIDQLLVWMRGGQPVGDGVETGDLVVEGPYRWVRHPMYAAGFFALWAEPHWTRNYLAFACAASLYLWLGSVHEERRLLRFYEEAYRRYMEQTPRYLPRWRARG